MDETPQSPRIAQLAWAGSRSKARARSRTPSCTRAARGWDWRETHTRHIPGIKPADVLELL